MEFESGSSDCGNSKEDRASGPDCGNRVACDEVVSSDVSPSKVEEERRVADVSPSGTNEVDGSSRTTSRRASITTFKSAPVLQHASALGSLLLTTLRIDVDGDSTAVKGDLYDSAPVDPYAAWGELLANWDESLKKRKKTLRQMVYRGVPSKVRIAVWPKLCMADDSELKDTYRSLIDRDSPFSKIIRRDLSRTFPEHDLFKDADGAGQESLLNIMKAYSLYDREVGYCQGSPFIAGLLLMQMPEEDAFCVFVRVMQAYSMRDLFKPSMAALEVCLHLLDKLLQEHDSELYAHFQSKGLVSTMYASSWFLTLFASTLTLDASFRLMDIFLCDGMDAIFRVALAILLDLRDKLLQLDMAGMMAVLQGKLRVRYSEENELNILFDKCFQLKIQHQKLVKAGKEYQLREKDTEERAENKVLRVDNVKLCKRIEELESEMSAMTQQLVSGKVSYAEEVESEARLRNRVSVARRQIKEKLAEQSGKQQHDPLPLHGPITESKAFLELRVAQLVPNTKKLKVMQKNCRDLEFALASSKIREAELGNNISEMKQLESLCSKHESDIVNMQELLVKLKTEVGVLNQNLSENL